MSSFRYNINHVSSSSRNSGLLSSQKSVYDGVFGGAPRSGLANALAPRLEDYAEIFGSRSCSIPLLEVPVIDGCDSRLLHFDYSEVFGEYGNNFVAMSSFQELFDGGDCGYDADYHPWSPEQCGSISDEFGRLARAEKSPGSSDGDSLRSSELFNESDNKHTPIRTSRVSNSEASVHCSKHETTDDIICNEVADDRITGTEQDSKFSPVRLSRIESSKSHRNDDYERAQDTPFITVSDISLRTKPSGLPPPSRAPPALTVKKRRAESDAGREVNASDSSQEMESMNKNIETMSKGAKETLGKDDIWSSITWDIEDVMKAEEGEDSVTSPCDEEREGSSVSIEKHSDLQGVHCSTLTGDSFVGIVSWSVETDYYDIFEGNNAAMEAFETIGDFNYLTQQRSPDDHRYQRTVDSMTLHEKQNPKLGVESPIQNVETDQIERISSELQWSQEKQLLNNENLKSVGPVRDFRKKIPELIRPPGECEDNVIDHGGILKRIEVNDNKNELKKTFDLKRYGMVIEEADEHEETDEGSFEAVPCEKDIMCQLPREGRKCEERLEGAIDHGFHGLRYDGNSKEQKFSKENENDDALKRGNKNGYFSPGKEVHHNKQVLEANLRLNVDTYELNGMANQDEEREHIHKNDDLREVSNDAFIDLASPLIIGNFVNPLEASEGAVRCEGNQTSKVVPGTHIYKSQHVIDNPLFNVKRNRPNKTENEDGTAHGVSKKIITTRDDGEQEMKTSESVISVNASKESVDVRKMEREPSTSEQNDDARHSKIATRGVNAKINTDQERESNLKHGYLRKLEEEKEREREREKDRMDVNTVVLEGREKFYTEKSSTEARHKAIADAGERLEKDSVEARLRAERAAVERATAEARQRATEKLISEKTSYNARDRLQQSVSEKFVSSAKYDDLRQSSLPSDLRGTVLPRHNTYSSSSHVGNEGESPQRCKARLERYRRTAERAANALAEKNKRDLLAQREKEERNRVAEVLDPELRRWANGKEGNLRALLSTLQYILGPDSGWQPVPLTKIITSAAVKTAYRKATLCVHPDKLQQRGATVQQKYVCEKVFDLLKEAWNKFSSEERC